MNPALKDYARATFPDSKSDLFAMFIERGFEWCKPSGFNSMVTMQSWMFLSSYEAMRVKTLQEQTIQTMAHLGSRAFSEISGEVVQTTAFVQLATHQDGFKPVFFRLTDGGEFEKRASLLSRGNRIDEITQSDFYKIPGAPIAYWASHQLIDIFSTDRKIEDYCHSFQGIITGDNENFVRFWFELAAKSISWNLPTFKSAEGVKTWIPYSKGGGFRKWYGNNEHVLRWNGSGNNLTRNRSENRDYFFVEGLSWSDIASSKPSFRFQPMGVLFDAKAPSAFFDEDYHFNALGLLNSKLVEVIAPFLNPTLSFQIEGFYKIPFNSVVADSKRIAEISKECISLSKTDWDSYENSWDYSKNWIVSNSESNFQSSFEKWEVLKNSNIQSLRFFEEESNRIILSASGLQSELSSEVPESQITLARADREKDCQRLISYAIGCMMGRYSLDEPGLIYAHAGNVGFEPGRYATFPADADGIVPVTDELWFADDACSRIREFLRAVWGPETLEENLAWLAESVGTKAAETPDETIRRYVADKFFKDHLQTYKKRPIYWLFSSGKQGAFQCLVYLHRYHEGTLSRMRAEYVVPLTAKIAARIDLMNNDAQAASSAASRTKINKQIEGLRKKQTELLAFDEKLRHYADMRIKLDLDDGVKANYGKFGDLLDSVKAITGGSEE